MKNKVTVSKLKTMKEDGEKITALTAWDFISGRFADAAGVEIVLVGDSLSMTICGDENTLGITLDNMIYHAAMVARAVKAPLLVGDMPFMSYQVGAKEALINAGRFVKEGKVQAVKIEGGRRMKKTVRRVVAAGIPVMGHIGLTPQSIHQMGGMRVQGKATEDAKRIIEDARILEEAGAFSLVLECLPAELAARVSESIAIPTIGIGAGINCDGQIQVTADVLGMLTDVAPRHAKKYADLAGIITKALRAYVEEVKDADFPKAENSFSAPEALSKFLANN